MSDVKLLANQQAQPPQSPAQQLVYSTARIECDYGKETGTGTGFFVFFCKRGDQYVPAIVTNKHVLEGATRATFYVHLRDEYGQPSIARSYKFILDDIQRALVPHPDPLVDLCAMPIAALYEHAQKEGHGMLGIVPFGMDLVPTDQELAELTPLEEVLMIGYPNGIWDSRNNMPIFRRGITATHPGVEYEGRREFMIDAACFPGSSGSPVLLYNVGTYFKPNGDLAIGTRVKLLGILRAVFQHTIAGELQIVPVPTHQTLQAVSQIPNNLGIVIQASRLRFFDEHFAKSLPKTT